MVETTRPVQWGLLGCGWVARDYIGPAIRTSRNAALCITCDPDPTAMIADVPSGTDLATFLATPGLEAVYVAAPNHLHGLLVEQVTRAGLAVLCEKPMASTLQDATAMVTACDHAQGVYATAFDQRFHAAHQHIAQMIHQGALGTITAIRIVYACWLPREWTPDGRAHDNWRIDPARAGGGAMIDLAPHGLDLASMLIGEDLVDISAFGQTRVQDYPVDDGAMLIARAASGTLVQLHVAYNCPDALPRRILEVVGTHAMIRATNTMGQVGGGEVTMIDAATGHSHRLDIPEIERSPFVAMIESFSDHLRSSTDFPFPPARDLRIMALLDKAQRQIARQIFHSPA